MREEGYEFRLQTTSTELNSVETIAIFTFGDRIQQPPWSQERLAENTCTGMQRWNKALRDDMSEFARQVWWNEQFHISGGTEDFGFFIISTKKKKTKQKQSNAKSLTHFGPVVYYSQEVSI